MKIKTITSFALAFVLRETRHFGKLSASSISWTKLRLGLPSQASHDDKAKRKSAKLVTVSNLPKIVILSAVIIVIGVISASYYFYNQYQKTQELLKNPAVAAKEETKKLVAEVGLLIELPVNEQPTVATVTDINKLKDQLFFSKAKNGDKVLIYTQAKKAILYRSSIQKVIDVAPVNIGKAEQTKAAIPTKIVLYNGTQTGGLTTTIEKQLKGKIKNIDVVAKENAKNDYTKTIVVDLLGNQNAVAVQLAILLKGEVGKFPEGEVKPTGADILVILGTK